MGNRTTRDFKNIYKEEMQGKSIMTLVLGAEYFILRSHAIMTKFTSLCVRENDVITPKVDKNYYNE